LGNVATRTEYRRQGHGTHCTLHLLSKLFEVVDLVSLNVKEKNVSAIRMYERIGFQSYGRMIMAFCERVKQPL
jgi:ribosomal protein S18 acetylase RimI-like enzyme